MAEKSKSWPADIKLPELPVGDEFEVQILLRVHAETVLDALRIVTDRLTAARREPQRASTDPTWLEIREIAGKEVRVMSKEHPSIGGRAERDAARKS